MLTNHKQFNAMALGSDVAFNQLKQHHLHR